MGSYRITKEDEVKDTESSQDAQIRKTIEGYAKMIKDCDNLLESISSKERIEGSALTLATETRKDCLISAKKDFEALLLND